MAEKEKAKWQQRLTFRGGGGSGSCLILLQLRCGKEEQWQRMEGAKAMQVNVANCNS